MKKLLLFLILITFPVSLITSVKAFASANFTTNYNVTYQILPNAVTHVTFDISITNQTSKYYAPSYGIFLGFNDVKNLSAKDDQGNIAPTEKKTDAGDEINVTFHSPATGVDKSTHFSISFDSNEIADKEGSVWEVNIPGLSNKNDFQSFNVTVVTPAVFGTPAYIKPLVPVIEKSDTHTLQFSKEDLGSSGISIAYATQQLYEFSLRYHIANKNLFPIETEIALPPQTNYQTILISDIRPKPQQVHIDNDGNWLATYSLNPSQKLDISVVGKAKVFLSPQDILVNANQNLSDYLKPQTYWETTNPGIVALAKKLQTPEAIYNYLVANLHYDFSRVTKNEDRLGAALTLQNPNSAVCLEFTDLFIALSRAAGIPAREIDGYAFTKNSKERPLSLVKDVLHAWPEYYDKNLQKWIMVDPTWGNTTGGVDYFHVLDFDHLVLVIKGENSSYPIPAGGYKTAETDPSEKDIDVHLTDSFDDNQPTLETSANIPRKLVAGFPIQDTITITNTGSLLAQPQILTIATMYLLPHHQTLQTIAIPPFGHQTIVAEFNKTGILTKRDDTVTISLNGKSLTQSVAIAPFFFNGQFLLGGGIILGSITIFLSYLAYRSRHLLLSKRQK